MLAPNGHACGHLAQALARAGPPSHIALWAACTRSWRSLCLRTFTRTSSRWSRDETVSLLTGYVRSGRARTRFPGFTHYSGLCPTPRGRRLFGTPSTTAQSRHPAREKSSDRLPAPRASPRAGGWRRRGSPCVGTSLRVTVAAGVACPLCPHEGVGRLVCFLDPFTV